jgi:hypothetical protein
MRSSRTSRRARRRSASGRADKEHFAFGEELEDFALGDEELENFS